MDSDTVTLNPSCRRRGVTAVWPCQQSGHADQTATLTLPTERCSAVGIPRLQPWEEVQALVSRVPRGSRETTLSTLEEKPTVSPPHKSRPDQ